MIRIARIVAATLLLAGALTLFFFARGTLHRGLALCFAVLSAFWLALPFLEGGEERGRGRASTQRTLNGGALFAGTAGIAIAAVGRDPLLGGVEAVVGELLVLFVWLASILPAHAPFTKEEAAPREEGPSGPTYLQRRALRLVVAFLAGGGSAAAALGLSSSVRVPYILIVLLGFAWLVVTIAVIRRSTISVGSAEGGPAGVRPQQGRRSGVPPSRP